MYFLDDFDQKEKSRDVETSGKLNCDGKADKIVGIDKDSTTCKRNDHLRRRSKSVDARPRNFILRRLNINSDLDDLPLSCRLEGWPRCTNINTKRRLDRSQSCSYDGSLENDFSSIDKKRRGRKKKCEDKDYKPVSNYTRGKSLPPETRSSTSTYYNVNGDKFESSDNMKEFHVAKRSRKRSEVDKRDVISERKETQTSQNQTDLIAEKEYCPKFPATETKNKLRPRRKSFCNSELLDKEVQVSYLSHLIYLSLSKRNIAKIN